MTRHKKLLSRLSPTVLQPKDIPRVADVEELDEEKESFDDYPEKIDEDDVETVFADLVEHPDKPHPHLPS